MNKLVDIHADDYGYSLNTSRDIIDCIKSGNLDSFSIIGNMPGFEDSMNLLYDSIPSFKFLPNMSVHINLSEGVFIDAFFPKTWGQLFLTINNEQNRNIIKKEIINQIEIVQHVINKCIEIAKKNGIPFKQKNIRLDSHIHTHLIPVVWNALIMAVDERKYHIEYIRNPKEPLYPFVLRPNSYSFINFIKNRILMIYSIKVDKYCEKNGLAKSYMLGLMMSGCMNFDGIDNVFGEMFNYANRHNRYLEILFHPGMATKNEYNIFVNNNYFRNANLSLNRHIEKDAIIRFNEIVNKVKNEKRK